MTEQGGKKAKGGLTASIDPKLVSALSHPLRVHILHVLSEVTASPSDLARDAGLSVNYVAYHVKELEKVGFVELVKTEPRRGTVEHYYRAKRRFFIDDPEWERLPEAVRTGMSVNVLRMIVKDAKEALDAESMDAHGSHMSHTRLPVDEKGWKDLTEVLSETLSRVLELQAECAERLEASGEEPTTVSVGLTCFEVTPRLGAEADAPAGE